MKAFRDTWRDGIHSYLAYLRDRLTVARDLLAESGSVFVQIGDENVHRVRALMDEVFGEENFVTHDSVTRSSIGLGRFACFHTQLRIYTHVWYSKSKASLQVYRHHYGFRKLDARCRLEQLSYNDSH